MKTKTNNGTPVLRKEDLVARAMGAQILRGGRVTHRRYEQLMTWSVRKVLTVVRRETNRIRGRKDASRCYAALIASADAVNGGTATTRDMNRWAKQHSEKKLSKFAVAWMTAHFA